jgi:PAT family beta-lactamase induction signal transducer AmpG
MLFLGISAGLPLLLIFSSLSLWLREAGIERAAVTYFSWAALGYSFKFIWAPLVDVLPLPFLTARMGRRRAWLLFAQVMIISAICLMALVDPAKDSLTLMAFAAVLLGFSSATQDIVIDAYRIESAETKLQALMSSTYIAGYRIGMLAAGAGALFLAAYFGSSSEIYLYAAWQQSYFMMAGLMLIGVVTTMVITEPDTYQTKTEKPIKDYAGLFTMFVFAVLGFIACFYFSSEIITSFKQSIQSILGNQYLSSVLVEVVRLAIALAVAMAIAMLAIKAQLVEQDLVVTSYVSPIQDFFQRYGWSLAWLLLALVGLYRISDIVLGVIANVFFQDLGFSKQEIASVVKTFGLFMTILGGFLGGVLVLRYGVLRVLFLGAVLVVATNLLFMLLAYTGYDLLMLYVVISADNLSAGLASAAFIAFLSSLTNISFTAVQYAIFSSLMTLLPKMIGGYSGSMVDAMGYPQFFLIASLLGLPVLLLIAIASRRFDFEHKQS